MRHYRTREMREHDATAWAALVFGALDLADDPLPEDDEIPCARCGQVWAYCQCHLLDPLHPEV